MDTIAPFRFNRILPQRSRILSRTQIGIGNGSNLKNETPGNSFSLVRRMNEIKRREDASVTSLSPMKKELERKTAESQALAIEHVKLQKKFQRLRVLLHQYHQKDEKETVEVIRRQHNEIQQIQKQASTNIQIFLENQEVCAAFSKYMIRSRSSVSSRANACRQGLLKTHKDSQQRRENLDLMRRVMVELKARKSTVMEEIAVEDAAAKNDRNEKKIKIRDLEKDLNTKEKQFRDLLSDITGLEKSKTKLQQTLKDSEGHMRSLQKELEQLKNAAETKSWVERMRVDIAKKHRVSNRRLSRIEQDLVEEQREKISGSQIISNERVSTECLKAEVSSLDKKASMNDREISSLKLKIQFEQKNLKAKQTRKVILKPKVEAMQISITELEELLKRIEDETKEDLNKLEEDAKSSLTIGEKELNKTILSTEKRKSQTETEIQNMKDTRKALRRENDDALCKISELKARRKCLDAEKAEEHLPAGFDADYDANDAATSITELQNKFTEIRDAAVSQEKANSNLKLEVDSCHRLNKQSDIEKLRIELLARMEINRTKHQENVKKLSQQIERKLEHLRKQAAESAQSQSETAFFLKPANFESTFENAEEIGKGIKRTRTNTRSRIDMRSAERRKAGAERRKTSVEQRKKIGTLCEFSENAKLQTKSKGKSRIKTVSTDRTQGGSTRSAEPTRQGHRGCKRKPQRRKKRSHCRRKSESVGNEEEKELSNILGVDIGSDPFKFSCRSEEPRKSAAAKFRKGHRKKRQREKKVYSKQVEPQNKKQLHETDNFHESSKQLWLFQD